MATPVSGSDMHMYASADQVRCSGTKPNTKGRNEGQNWLSAFGGGFARPCCRVWRILVLLGEAEIFEEGGLEGKYADTRLCKRLAYLKGEC